ncbi:Pfs NACHT and WD domain protein [Penicillium canariense]|uniref:Mitochondrial division protein 1 n=1 Tax=Penicillium canariense TaxID=189055 RepID=A0A9W9HWB4_9EURO|nr:Pfs NACHT and WD domain protein [Penicillium canariense]KAJ5157505.1 Pfs NACHT and WD domain protein [Penicillium canariense]
MQNPPGAPGRYEDYTVAVICAIGFEMSAVRYMLDHEHYRLPPRQGDSNIYVLGELSGHNIVLACLPGNQGKGAAAVVATNMVRTFPSIKWRFLVGIGGGVPSDKHDIRLGDVVISMPEGQYGGVVQLDLGKDTEVNFQLKGFLWPPPTMLRGAVELMRSEHLMAENKVEEHLSQMLQRGPRLSVYQRPATGHDVLFDTDYPHVESRSACENCDRTKIISRPSREFPGPVVHYGLIASGDRVMRSATKRKAASGNVGDILCFEMEAAGIATEFPCIVIRGISDYADSHKNDSWQHYAAAAAAASAKELLSYVSPEQRMDDATTGSPGQRSPPAAASCGGNLYIEYHNKDITSSDLEHHLWRDFLEDLCESDPNTDMTRIEEDKGSLLPKCFDWILDNEELKAWQECENNRLLWVRGGPGKGKTMLMIGLVRHLKDRLRTENCALAFFFCQNTDQRLNNGISVLRGLVWMLLCKNLVLSKHIPEEYRLKSKEKRKVMLDSQNPNLFSTLKMMLENILGGAPFDRVYLLVDGLDECDKDSDQLVRWMTQVAGRTLRPSQYRQILDLELKDEHISRAVAQFIEQKVKRLAEEGQYDKELQQKVQTKLEKKAESTFLWVALICQRLNEVPRMEVMAEIDKFPLGLPALYDRMMHIIEQHGDETSLFCKQILRTVTIVYRPITLEELVPLANLPSEQYKDVHELVSLCSSFVILRESMVRLLHQSAKDYLYENYQSRLQQAGVAQGHADISRRSINAMSSVLKQNMYNLSFSFKPEYVRPPEPDPLAPVRYSSVFWADHLCFLNGESPETKRLLMDHGPVLQFLNENFLRWLESLALLGKLSDGVQAIKKLVHVTQLQLGASTPLLEFLKDAEKFVLSHRSIIERAPLQVYGSALAFSPTMSKVRNMQWKERLSFINMIAGVREGWSAHQQTLEGHSDGVKTVAFSPDGKTLASASRDCTVKLWVTATGAPQQTLEGHSNWVNDVVFSPNGKTLASASADHTIRLWGTMTGSLQRTFEGHYDSVRAVAFSPNGKILVSASSDYTVRLWDTATGGSYMVLRGHSGSVRAVAFSPDGKMLASASGDCTIRLWDIATGAPQQTLEGHSRPVSTVAFSPDGKTLASASGDHTIRLWDIATGAPKTLSGHGNWVSAVAFSPDGKTIASVSGDHTIRLWDTATGAPQRTLQGHSNWVSAVAFSPDGKILASASADYTVRLWDTATGMPQQTLEGHGKWINAVAFSPDGKTLSSASDDCTVRLWDTAVSMPKQVLERHSSPINSVALSPDRKSLASASDDTTVRLWDTATGTSQRTLKGHSASVNAVVFSTDGKKLASASADHTLRLWVTATGMPQRTLKGHSGSVTAVTFSPDGNTLASASADHTVRLWDTATGATQRTLQGHYDEYVSEVISPDDMTRSPTSIKDWGREDIRFISGWVPKNTLGTPVNEVPRTSARTTPGIAAYRTARHMVSRHSISVKSVAFSPDSKTLASISDDSTVQLWDAETGSHRQTLKGNSNSWDTTTGASRGMLGGHSSPVHVFAFSEDGQYLKTDHGFLRLSVKYHPPDKRIEQKHSDYALSVGTEWVKLGGENLLWLPKDYRATCGAIYGHTAVLGHRSGGVTFLQFEIP